MSKVQHKKVKLSPGELKAWATQLTEDKVTFTIDAHEGTLKIIASPTFAVPMLENRCRNRWRDISDAMPGQSGNSSPEDYDWRKL